MTAQNPTSKAIESISPKEDLTIDLPVGLKQHADSDLHLIEEAIAPPTRVANIGLVAALGTSPFPARADHVHALNDGSVSSPAIGWGGMGWYRIDANTIGFASAGALRLSASNTAVVSNVNFTAPNVTATSTVLGFNVTANNVVQGGGVTGTIWVTSPSVTGSTQIRASRSGFGTIYADAQVFAGNNGNESALSLWALNVASQFRQAANAQVVYCRNWDDGGYTQLNGIFVNFSSRRGKMDISNWPAPVPSPVGSAVNSLETNESAIDVVKKIRVVQYRWKKELQLGKAPEPRRAQAVARLNSIRESKGLEKWQVDNPDEFIHNCERDFEDCLKGPTGECLLNRNWQEGFVGVIAQEVGEVFPQAASLDYRTGEYEGVDPVALASLAIAALQEQSELISSLQGRIAELESRK